MKTKPIQRGLSLISAIAMILTVLAVPAFAAPSATASLEVDDRQVLAGDANQVFDITVSNTGATGGILGLQDAGETINAVVIQAPTYFATLGTQGVDGWDAKKLSNNRVLFKATTNNPGIQPAQSFTFPVPGPVGEFAMDDAARFSVTVSSNGGRDLASASPSSDGALTSIVEVLNLPNFQLTAPNGATDLSVTDGQSNVEFDVTVENLATETLVVTPEIVKQDGNSSIAARITEVDGASATGPTVTIPSKGSSVVTFAATFTGVGTIDLNVAATAPGADTVGAPELTRSIAVQQATDIVFSSANPQVAPVGGPGALNVNFDKTGAPSGTFASTLTLVNGSTTKTITVPDLTFTEGGQTLSLSYPLVFATTDTEGLYDATFTHTGVDANGAVVTITQSVEDLIRFDKSLPIFQNLKTLLPDGTAVKDEVPAAGNGRRLQVTGSVVDNGVSCGDCTISLQLVTGDGKKVGDARAVTNNGGSFDTTFEVQGLPPAIQAGSLIPSLTAFDVAGNGGGSTGAPSVPFDTREAQIPATFPVTGGLAQANDESEVLDRIDVIFDEGVAVPSQSLAAQWSVTNNRVESVDIRSAVLTQDLTVKGTENRGSTSPTSVSKTFKKGTRVWFARLDLASNLGRNALPTVTYDPDANLGGSSGVTAAQTRIFDRVDLRTLAGVQDAFDNIAPVLPILSTVNGLGQQWDDDKTKKFFSKGGATTMTLTDVAPGTIVEVTLIESDGTSSKLGSFENASQSGSSVQFDVNLGQLDRDVTIRLQAFDSGAKDSGIVDYPVVVDTTAPAALSARRLEDNRVLVTANDVLPYGADADLDFVIEATDARGRTIAVQVTDVAKPAGSEGDPQSLGADAFLALNQRILTLDQITYDLSTLTFKVARYDAQFGEDTIYVDRAGNKLASPTGFNFTP